MKILIKFFLILVLFLNFALAQQNFYDFELSSPSANSDTTEQTDSDDHSKTEIFMTHHISDIKIFFLLLNKNSLDQIKVAHQLEGSDLLRPPKV